MAAEAMIEPRSKAFPGARGSSRRALEVPAYYLYGEDWTAESFGFFHIEPFAIRNIPNNWRIGLHRHPDFHQFSITFAGGCVFEHDGVERTATGPCCIFTPANAVHQFTYEPDSVGYVISMSPDFLAGLTLEDGSIKAALLRLTTQRLVTLNDDVGGENLRKLVALIAESFGTSRGNGREMLRHLFGACLLGIDAATAQASAGLEQENRSTANAAELFDRFRGCLETDLEIAGRSGNPPAAPLTVDSFASRLSTTPYALNAACRRALGRSAREVVQTALLGQATRLLLYSKRSIKEIAYGLGYSHPSHFVRFFKHHRGTTPEIFRQQVAEPKCGSAGPTVGAGPQPSKTGD
jgi:AraC family transcriptional activator of pobA